MEVYCIKVDMEWNDVEVLMAFCSVNRWHKEGLLPNNVVAIWLGKIMLWQCQECAYVFAQLPHFAGEYEGSLIHV